MSLSEKLSGLVARQLPGDRILALRTRYLGLRVRFSPLLKAVHGTFTTEDLRRHLDDRVGRQFEVLMVHSSLNYMHPYYQGHAQELLQMLIDFVGPDRTLVMPAFYLGDPALNDVVASYRRNPRFDARRTPSQMGMLTELYRRRTGVKVSLHPSHRVAALGPLAEELTATHFAAGTTFGPGTPFAAMAAHDTAVISIGKSCEVLTQVHHVEDLLGPDFPVPSIIEEVRIVVKDRGGQEVVYDMRWRKFLAQRRMQKLRGLMSRNRLQEWRFHGVPLFYTRAAWVTEDLLSAARAGRTIYLTGSGNA